MNAALSKRSCLATPSSTARFDDTLTRVYDVSVRDQKHVRQESTISRSRRPECAIDLFVSHPRWISRSRPSNSSIALVNCMRNRSRSVPSGRFISNSGSNPPTESYPFTTVRLAEMPRLVDPSSGFIVNANNDPRAECRAHAWQSQVAGVCTARRSPGVPLAQDRRDIVILRSLALNSTYPLRQDISICPATLRRSMSLCLRVPLMLSETFTEPRCLRAMTRARGAGCRASKPQSPGCI